MRYGYLLILDPGEGSETVALALSTFRQPEESRRSRRPPLWYGQGFTKNQYAENFIQVHETVCRVLDIAREESLLLKASDNCGYFASRSWKNASKRVNEEMLFARMVLGLVGVTVGNLREEGVQVRVLEDNASKASPVEFASALAREQKSAPAPSETRRTQGGGEPTAALRDRQGVISSIRSNWAWAIWSLSCEVPIRPTYTLAGRFGRTEVGGLPYSLNV